VSPDPAVPRRPAGPVHRILRPVAIGLAVVAAAAAVIIWLPLDAEVAADLKTALVGYETAREVAWPATRPIAVPLKDADQAALAAEVRRSLSAYAAEDALAGFDVERVVRRFAEAAMLDQPWVVTKWEGEVVCFDFTRRCAATSSCGPACDGHTRSAG